MRRLTESILALGASGGTRAKILARAGALTCALGALSACTTWTSLHAGYGQALSSNRSVGGVEVRRALGSELHSGYGLVGVRVDSGEQQFDLEGHAGVMHPLRLAEAWTLAPSATVEFVRVSRVAGRWDGGALGPGLGSELLWWFARRSQIRDSGAMFGCMGGAQGVDCPRGCRVENVVRTGLGLRASAEYDIRFGSTGQRGLGDSILWLTLGISHAASSWERECCYFDFRPPLRKDCEILR